MKIAFFGHDLFAHVPERLMEAGHQICQLFTCPADRWNSNEQIIRFARSNRIPSHFHKPVLGDIQECVARGIELLLVAAYPYRIPGSDLVRGINVHPTMLPLGRGNSPVPWLIMRYPDQAALTLHKLTATIDSGDILVQRRITVDPLEDMESFCGKLQLSASALILETITNLDQLWAAGRPQEGPGSYWPEPTDSDRTLDGSLTVAENLRIVRAFGNFAARVVFDGCAWSVMSASGWEEQHSVPLGSPVSRTNQYVVLAVKDGYVVLRQFRPEQPADRLP